MLGRYDSILFARATEYRAFRTRSFPPGSVFADMFELPVPRGVVPGRYTLYVREGDYPTDADRGIPLGEIAIVDQKSLAEKSKLQMPWCDAGGGGGGAGDADKKAEKEADKVEEKSAKKKSTTRGAVPADSSDPQEGGE